VGPKLRITTQLAEAASGTQVWASRVDRRTREIFDVQDEVVEGVITALASNLRQVEVSRLRRKPPQDLQAWELCARATAAYYDDVSGAEFEASVQLLRRAVERDPDFAHAWGLLGFFTALKFPVGVSSDRAADIEKSLSCTARVLELSPGDPVLLTFRSSALQYAGRPQESLPLLERSLRVNPSGSLTHLYCGRRFMFTGKPDRALEHFERPHQLNPGAGYAEMYHALASLFLGRFGEAARVAEQTVQLADQMAWACFALMIPRQAPGQDEAAKCALLHLRRVASGWTPEFVETFLREREQGSRPVALRAPRFS